MEAYEANAGFFFKKISLADASVRYYPCLSLRVVLRINVRSLKVVDLQFDWGGSLQNSIASAQILVEQRFSSHNSGKN